MRLKEIAPRNISTKHEDKFLLEILQNLAGDSNLQLSR